MKYNFLTKRLRIIVYELATEILRVFQLPVKLKLKFVAEEHFFEETMKITMDDCLWQTLEYDTLPSLWK